MRALALCLLALTFSACDSGIEPNPIFDALAGEWRAADGSQSLRFGRPGAFERIERGRVTAEGLVSLAYNPTAGDAEAGALAELIAMDFRIETSPNSAVTSSTRVLSATHEAFTLRGCIVAPCADGEEIRRYIRVLRLGSD